MAQRISHSLWGSGLFRDAPLSPDFPGTLYVGGGTPTYLDADILDGIISDVKGFQEKVGYRPNEDGRGRSGSLSLHGDGDYAFVETRDGNNKQNRKKQIEFTVEGNPGSITKEKLEVLRRNGCNRLSVGVQSFEHRELVLLGRSHTVEEFQQAWTLARETGFDNMSMDLMYGLPNQTLEQWEQTLHEALRYSPEHISLYQLSVEPDTVLETMVEEGRVCMPEDELCRSLYLMTDQMLTDAGFLHYEISNYAKPGFESRHNSLYWRNGYYIGLGAGAAGHLPGTALALVSKRDEKKQDLDIRYTNKGNLEDYLRDVEQGLAPIEEQETIDRTLGMTEELMLGFRLREGIGKQAFQDRWGISIEEAYGKALDKHLDAGFLEDDGYRFRPTIEGWLLYNHWITDYF